MKKYIGIDLGGTNVRVAVVDENGNILESIKRPSLAKQEKEKIIENIIDMIESLKEKDFLAIGIGVPGPVDAKRNIMTLSTNLNGFAFYDFASILKDKFHVNVFLNNDANVAGLGEAVLGAGKDCDIVYYITHSTGIGGALVINKQIVSGHLGYAGEIANIIVDRNGEKINHLNIGAIENIASGTAIGWKAKKIYNDETMEAHHVFDKARQQDTKALEIIDQMSYDFAQMMSCIGHVVDPDCFVIGGGVSNASDLYFDKVLKYYNQMVHEQMKDVKIYKAQLQEPGVVGAAMLAMVNDK